jgi:NhaA family Na+:H+ antiporter
LAVLAVVGTHLPSALRAFLLTLAAVEDLITIVIIVGAGFTATIPHVFASGSALSSWASSSSRAA